MVIYDIFQHFKNVFIFFENTDSVIVYHYRPNTLSAEFLPKENPKMSKKLEKRQNICFILSIYT